MASGTLQSLRLSAPAKVNLTLAVLGRLDDGFHDIESWVVQADWCDRLLFEPSDRLLLRVSGRGAGVPRDHSNLAYRAAETLADAAGRTADVLINLEKTIPSGAGLGGGSSDAAAVLLGLNQRWGLNWAIDRLTPLAESLGSDVPLFLAPGPAMIRGRGTLVDRFADGRSPPWSGWLVLIVPPFQLSTAEVYQKWSESEVRPSSGRRWPWRLGPLAGQTLMAELFNDLEAAAFELEPRLRQLHAQVDGLSGQPVRMTGSGAGLFTIFDDRACAEEWIDGARACVDADVELRAVRTRGISSLMT